MRFSFFMKDVAGDHSYHNVGQCYWIVSVNRTTGEVLMDSDNPWPGHNKRSKEALDAAGLELCEDGLTYREKK